MTNPDHPDVSSIVAAFVDAAPEGWIRIVRHIEADADEDGDLDMAAITVVIVATESGLTSEYMRTPSVASFELRDMLTAYVKELGAAGITMDLEIDADGTHRVEFQEERSKLLEGVRDEESWDRWHEYLQHNRADLEALAERLSG